MNITEKTKIVCANEEQKNSIIDVLNKMGEKYSTPRSRDREIVILIRKPKNIIESAEAVLNIKLNNYRVKVFEFENTFEDNKQFDHVEELLFSVKTKFETLYDNDKNLILVGFEPAGF